jgi:hypothetical protein
LYGRFPPQTKLQSGTAVPPNPNPAKTDCKETAVQPIGNGLWLAFVEDTAVLLVGKFGKGGI